MKTVSPRKPHVPKPFPGYPAPAIGMQRTVYGVPCRITAILPMGTIELESLDGAKNYRETGLPFS